jgi:hypothetical protein
MIIERTVYEVLETGTYTARVTEVRPEEGKFGPQLKLRFALDSGATLTAWASEKLTDKTKLGRWVTAILGAMPDNLDTDALVGRDCRVKIGVKTRDDNSEYNRVEDVLPLHDRVTPPATGELSLFCCECGAAVEVYTPDGRAWCENHRPSRVT